VRHVLEGIIRDEAREDTVEQWVKFARQDIAGVLTALQVTNGPTIRYIRLGSGGSCRGWRWRAILGVLIFRAIQ
jgi:hypothetical protein